MPVTDVCGACVGVDPARAGTDGAGGGVEADRGATIDADEDRGGAGGGGASSHF